VFQAPTPSATPRWLWWWRIASSPFVIPRRKAAPSGVGIREEWWVERASERLDAGGLLKGGGKARGGRLAKREKLVLKPYWMGFINGFVAATVAATAFGGFGGMIWERRWG